MTKENQIKEKCPKIFVIIPALNEEKAIGRVIQSIPKNIVDKIIIVDNGSTDRTPIVAERFGAYVKTEPKKGYGNACLAGMNYISSSFSYQPDIIVFMDGDYSDYPEEMDKLTNPIIEEDYDLVIGSRIIGKMEKHSIPNHAILANIVIGKFLTFLLGNEVTDLGPFRAIKYKKLLSLKMRDKNYGWTIEMIIKASKKGLKLKEIPVKYRKRIGSSKVSGNPVASIKAAIIIGISIFKYMVEGE